VPRAARTLHSSGTGEITASQHSRSRGADPLGPKVAKPRRRGTAARGINPRLSRSLNEPRVKPGGCSLFWSLWRSSCALNASRSQHLCVRHSAYSRRSAAVEAPPAASERAASTFGYLNRGDTVDGGQVPSRILVMAPSDRPPAPRRPAEHPKTSGGAVLEPPARPPLALSAEDDAPGTAPILVVIYTKEPPATAAGHGLHRGRATTQ
jgi:hypothetical protein